MNSKLNLIFFFFFFLVFESLDSTKKSDLLSNLHDHFLVLIISMLPFKESVQRVFFLNDGDTCIVKRQASFSKNPCSWNYLFFNRGIIEPTRFYRVLFVLVMREWISILTGKSSKNFELYFPNLCVLGKYHVSYRTCCLPSNQWYTPHEGAKRMVDVEMHKCLFCGDDVMINNR